MPRRQPEEGLRRSGQHRGGFVVLHDVRRDPRLAPTNHRMAARMLVLGAASPSMRAGGSVYHACSPARTGLRITVRPCGRLQVWLPESGPLVGQSHRENRFARSAVNRFGGPQDDGVARGVALRLCAGSAGLDRRIATTIAGCAYVLCARREELRRVPRRGLGSGEACTGESRRSRSWRRIGSAQWPSAPTLDELRGSTSSSRALRHLVGVSVEQSGQIPMTGKSAGITPSEPEGAAERRSWPW